MNKDQALALMKLIADLYQIISAPDPEPTPEPVDAPVSSNGRIKEPSPA